jgi:hypothetical protein
VLQIFDLFIAALLTFFYFHLKSFLAQPHQASLRLVLWLSFTLAPLAHFSVNQGKGRFDDFLDGGDAAQATAPHLPPARRSSCSIITFHSFEIKPRAASRVQVAQKYR